MTDAPTRREPMPSKEVGAQTVEFREREFHAHGFLDGDNVNVFITHVLDELAAAAIMAETADVPEEGTHHATIEGLLDPRTRDALWARRAAVRERVRPRSSAAVRGEFHKSHKEGAALVPPTRTTSQGGRAGLL